MYVVFLLLYLLILYFTDSRQGSSRGSEGAERNTGNKAWLYCATQSGMMCSHLEDGVIMFFVLRREF